MRQVCMEKIRSETIVGDVMIEHHMVENALHGYLSDGPNGLPDEGTEANVLRYIKKRIRQDLE